MYLGSYIKPYTHVHNIFWLEYHSLRNIMMSQVVKWPQWHDSSVNSGRICIPQVWIATAIVLSLYSMHYVARVSLFSHDSSTNLKGYLLMYMVHIVCHLLTETYQMTEILNFRHYLAPVPNMMDCIIILFPDLQNCKLSPQVRFQQFNLYGSQVHTFYSEKHML